MKTISEIRRNNLGLLTAEFGTVDAIANRCKTSPVYLSQVKMQALDLKTGKPRQMGSVVARKLEAGLGKPLGWMDTEHGDDGLEGDDFASFTHLDDSPAPSMQPILAWNHEDDLPPGEFVMIPRMAVNLSCGNGHEQTEIEFVKKQPQAFRADWIRQKHLKPAKLAAMSASGNSMEPRIWDGDSLVVDTSQTRVVDGKVYALWYDGGERVKRLFGMPGGGLRISSDNPAFETIEVGAAELEHVRILGRVVHIAGDGGL